MTKELSVRKRLDRFPSSLVGLLLVFILAMSCSLGGWARAQDTATPNPGALNPTVATRVEKIEKSLEEMKATGEKAEARSLQNKIMARQLIRLVTGIFIALIAIALIFPLTIWLLSRKRLLGLSGLSDEVAATILVVEERQTKLANILREIQTELDYVHSMSSAPDLKALIEQAEKFLEMNKRDLERVGGAKGEDGGPKS